MASQTGSFFKLALARGGVNWESADIRVALTTGFTFDPDVHHYMSDMTNECTGTGYARKTLANRSATFSPGNAGYVDLIADDCTWTGADFGTPDKAVVYVYNVSDSAALICGVLDMNNIVTNTGDYTIKWNSGATAGALFRL